MSVVVVDANRCLVLWLGLAWPGFIPGLRYAARVAALPATLLASPRLAPAQAPPLVSWLPE